MIDRDALAALTGNGDGSLPSALANEIRRLLVEVKERLRFETAYFVPVDRAAELLSMSESWIRQNTAPRGQCIPCARLGASVVYRPEALRQWAEEQERQSVEGLV